MLNDADGKVRLESLEDAFAFLDREDEKDPAAAEGGAVGEAAAPAAPAGDVAGDTEAQGEVPGGGAPGQADDGALDAGADGEPAEPGEPDWAGYTEEQINGRIDEMLSEREAEVSREVAALFAKEGVPTDSEGRLGLTVDDPRIRVVNDDGTITFINVETGKPFTGENPRRQAAEWVEDWNAELAKNFAKAVEGRMEAERLAIEPRIRTLRFASTYEKLDERRRDMLDAIIEDYEVTDENGDTVGYDCDLDKALAQVNRQIERLGLESAAEPAPDPSAPTGPEADMPAHGSGGASTEPRTITSLEDAFNYLNERDKTK